MRKILITLPVLLFALGANAQSKKEICAALAPPMLSASDSFITMSSSMRDMDFLIVAGKLDGEEGKKFRNLSRLRDKMMPEFDAFLAELDATALLLRKCSR
ncbi:hypothetical protein [Profundibacter sp.]